MTLNHINVKIFIRLVELEKAVLFSKSEIDSNKFNSNKNGSKIIVRSKKLKNSNKK